MVLFAVSALERSYEPAPSATREWAGQEDRCAGVTKAGHRCRLKARKNGFCGLYHVDAQAGARRMRLLVLASIAANTVAGVILR